MPPIVALDDALGHLGITPGADPAVDAKVSALLDAISAEVRRLTRRAFEGTATVYDEVLRLAGETVAILPNSPVTAVLAVRQIHFDGTEEEILEPRDVTDGASTALAAAASVGATNLKLDSVAGLAVGTALRIGTGVPREVVRAATVGTPGSGGTGVDVAPALRYAHALAEAAVEVNGSELWMLELPRRGRLRLARRMDYALITYVTSGEVPADVSHAVLEWLDEGWTAMQEPDIDPATRELSSQSHDSWSESYAPADEAGDINTAAAAIIARRPPTRVARVLLGYWHPSGTVGVAT